MLSFLYSVSQLGSQLRAWYFGRQTMRAIREAEKSYKLTRLHFLVLNMGGKPKVFSRANLKFMVKTKVFACSLKTLEQAAIYKTY